MSYEQVREQFDLPRLEGYTNYTTEHPPLQSMVAAYLGIGSAAKSAAGNQDEALTELIAQLPET